MVLVPKAVRVRTASGWQDVALTGPAGPTGPQGPQGPAGPTEFLNAQIVRGSQEAYWGPSTVPGGDTQMYRDPAGSNVLRLYYTPPVNAWWDCEINIGLVQKNDAAYNYLIGGLRLTPADADGQSLAYHYEMQHSAVQTYDHRQARRLFKLNAGVAYYVDGIIASAGGTWSYYCGPNQLAIMAMAFAR